MKNKFIVMKILTNVEALGISAKLNGCHGYIPVFDTIEEANGFTDNGKYEVVEVKIEDVKTIEQ